MTHFMKERCHFAVGDERWLVLGRFREVTDNGNHRAFYLAVEKALAAIGGHPGAVFLAFAGEEIAVQCTNKIAGTFIEELKSFYIFMPCLVTLCLFKIEIKEFGEVIKASFENRFEWEIRTQVLR